MPAPPWDIGRKGRSWTLDEMLARLERCPEKFEPAEGEAVAGLKDSAGA